VASSLQYDSRHIPGVDPVELGSTGYAGQQYSTGFGLSPGQVSIPSSAGELSDRGTENAPTWFQPGHFDG
jgi:hypothetical protein